MDTSNRTQLNASYEVLRLMPDPASNDPRVVINGAFFSVEKYKLVPDLQNCIFVAERAVGIHVKMLCANC